ncbi:DUF2783 domain-containing protein [Elioraea sp.]|uniref:DUF2783 domain-containing protein n=1 Tax=Elioraea sp. TaxID=2185103 RepID=UPI0021DF3187|nr:DUF2783 domain-containing protein [Elioraea sp.]GIX11475.1 MAG: hypothetical protein KatS3mg116_3185 [Elioraea sp.]
MVTLDTRPRLGDPDAVFVALVAAHRDLSPEESRRLDAALVLLLANHIGDAEVLQAAIAAARAAIRAPTEAAEPEGTVP